MRRKTEIHAVINRAGVICGRTTQCLIGIGCIAGVAVLLWLAAYDKYVCHAWNNAVYDFDLDTMAKLLDAHDDICSDCEIRVAMSELIDGGAHDEYDSAPAIIYASLHSNIEAVTLLLERGANVNATGPLGGMPLHWAVKHHNEKLAKLLLNQGADVEHDGADGLTPLGLAAGVDAVELIRILLEQGVDPDQRMRAGVTALMLAAREGSIRALHELLDAGADPLIEDVMSQSALAWAAKAYQRNPSPLQADAIEKLLSKEPPPEIVGKAILHAAVVDGDGTVLEWLAEYDGVDINARLLHGRFPLLEAAEYGSAANVRVLLRLGADPWMELGQTGWKPIDLAKSRNDAKRDEIVKLLQQAMQHAG